MVCPLGEGGQWEAIGRAGMRGRPLEEQTGAQGKNSVTFALLV